MPADQSSDTSGIALEVPSFGESITEVMIGEWVKSEGDAVAQDETVVVIESDKVTMEVPAPVGGIVSRILKGDGASAQVGEVIGYMVEAEVPAGNSARAEEPVVAASAPSAAPSGHVMPAAARAAAGLGVDSSTVSGTGPGGRILKEDIEREAGRAISAGPTAEKAAPAMPPTTARGAREEEIVPMTPMRQRIAARLVESQQTAALLTTFNEIDMSAVKALRAEYRDAFAEKNGVKLGFMSFFVKAAVEALKLIPQVNAEIRGRDIVYRNYYDIGIAVGGGRGLVVPVIRNAEALSFADIERSIADFGRRARENKLTLDELQGGTFTISNGGVYGSLMSTPIVNPPQAGILGLHAIQDRPVARDGKIQIRPMMYIALTYDHRLIDGRESVTFLKRIKECVENPSRILLEI